MEVKISTSLKCAIKSFICVNKMHRRLFDNQVSTLGIHQAKHRILGIIAHGENMTQKDIAMIMGISPAAVTGTIKKLELDGYVERKARESDNRANEITLTDKGREIFEKTKYLFAGADAAMFSDFTEKELSDFTSLLSKMKNNINKIENGDIEIPKLSDEDISKLLDFNKDKEVQR